MQHGYCKSPHRLLGTTSVVCADIYKKRFRLTETFTVQWVYIGNVRSFGSEYSIRWQKYGHSTATQYVCLLHVVYSDSFLTTCFWTFCWCACSMSLKVMPVICLVWWWCDCGLTNCIQCTLTINVSRVCSLSIASSPVNTEDQRNMSLIRSIAAFISLLHRVREWHCIVYDFTYWLISLWFEYFRNLRMFGNIVSWMLRMNEYANQLYAG